MVNKEWTLEEAFKAQMEFSKENPVSESGSPLHQWIALKNLDELEVQFKTDKSCLMDAIGMCAKHNLPMPMWVAAAYLEAYNRIASYEEKSWDAVFGMPYKKGAQLKALRRAQILKKKVGDAASAIRETHPNIATDKGLFEEIANRLGIGTRQAEELYYKDKKDLEITRWFLKPILERNYPRYYKKRG